MSLYFNTYICLDIRGDKPGYLPTSRMADAQLFSFQAKEAVMVSWKQIISKTLCFIFLSIPAVAFAGGQFGFESAEHLSAAENIKLYFENHDTGQTAHLIHLQNGLELNYGQIMSLAGDFYGVPGETISEGKTLEERKNFFRIAFSTLAHDSAAVIEVPKIYAVILQEHEALMTGLKNGEKIEDIFARIGDNDNRQWNCITGGGCSGLWWLSQGRYLNLAKKDFDHFGNNAWLAYDAGHRLAIETAIEAHQSHDTQKLATAYAMNAYASHFLTDRFAAGHLRTPRPELPASVTPSVIGSVLATFMHKEENKSGLHVHNLRGDHWFAAGDRYFFDHKNDENLQRLESALQESVNQVFYAYQYGTAPASDTMHDLIPLADETGTNVQNDISPLFYWDSASNTLFRRADTANAYDNHWTSNWWGWTTLVMLSQQYGLPAQSQRALITAGYGKEAMKYGLIKDKSLTEYVSRMP